MKGDCKELTRIPVVQQAIQDPGNRQLLEKIYSCIYKLFCTDFIKWIIKKNPGYNIDELTKTAKDAFQEGLIIFHSKIKKMGLKQHAALGTIIFTFARWQFMALKKKAPKNTVSFDESGFSSNYSNAIGELICEDELYWDDTLKMLFSEKEYQLHLAIRMLKKEWQKILYRCYFDHIKPSAIAVEMNVSEGHIYNILTIARKELKIILQSKFNFQNKANGTVAV
jgi:DNA-directed RNA polymerase specialized sigma24 family protein